MHVVYAECMKLLYTTDKGMDDIQLVSQSPVDEGTDSILTLLSTADGGIRHTDNAIYS